MLPEQDSRFSFLISLWPEQVFVSVIRSLRNFHCISLQKLLLQFSIGSDYCIVIILWPVYSAVISSSDIGVLHVNS